MHPLLTLQLHDSTRDGQVDYARLLALISHSYAAHDKALAELARDTASRLEQAFESSNDGIWIWDIASDNVWFSRRCESMLGLGANAFNQPGIRQWYALVHEPDAEAAREFINDALEDRPHARTLRFTYATGGVLHIMCRASVARDENGKPVRLVGVHTDVTDIMAMQEAFTLERNRVEAATRAKSDFLANMSHEIRTPMNSIMGMIELMIDAGLDPQQMLWAEIAKNSSAALLDIINDILDLSKIEAGKLTLETTPLDLYELVERATDTLALKVREKNLELLTRYSLNTPRFVIGDPVRLRQILINLVSNAIKFTREGSITIAISARGGNGGEVTLLIEVSDTGIGIPPDKQTYIFEKFSQAEESTTRKFGGTGLGLAICRRLVALMGGEIGVRSATGKGATFFFDLTLPVDTAASAAQPALRHDVRDLRVMVVDDNPLALDLFSDYFDSWGIRALYFTNAVVALAALGEASRAGEPFEVVLLDYHLRGQGGRLFVNEAKALGPHLQVVAMKNSDPGAGGKELQAQGFDGLVVKPFTPSRLQHKLSVLKQDAAQGTKGTLLTSYNLFSDRGWGKPKIGSDYSGLSVLVVEDIKANQIYMQALLKKYRCGVDTVANGIEAVDKIKAKSYDVVFMDCHMPEMDGFEATRVIRTQALPRQPFIIALTADAMRGDRERCLASGMDDYLNKPVNAERIVVVLEQAAQRTASPGAA